MFWSSPLRPPALLKMESVASRGATEPKACATTGPGETVNVGEIQLRHGYHFDGRVILSDGKL